MHVDLEQAVAEFLALADRCERAKHSARTIMAEMTAWYRDVRVQGAPLDEDADMLLVQWGIDEVLDLLEPLDLRGLGEARIRNLPETLAFDVVRQVFAPSDEESFDEGAVQMHITLSYGLIGALAEEGSAWIHTPGDVEAGWTGIAANPVVAALLDRTPLKYVSYVEYCG